MPTRTVTTGQRRAVVLRPEAWHAECVRAGLTTDTQRADALGTTRTAVNQIQNGRRMPSNEFIAGAVAYFGRRAVRFEELFEITPAGAS